MTTLADSVVKSPAERLKAEHIDVRNATTKLAASYQEIYTLENRLEEETSKDKVKRFKKELKLQKKSSKQLRKNLDQQIKELAVAQYAVDNRKLEE